MKNYKKNKEILEKSFNYSPEMEHDACGVGLIASTNGKKSRKIVEYGIEALKAIWHRGAVDADGKSGDGAGIQIEIAPDFFNKSLSFMPYLIFRSSTFRCLSPDSPSISNFFNSQNEGAIQITTAGPT